MLKLAAISPDRLAALARMVLRLCFVLALAFLAHLALDGAATLTERLPVADGDRMRALIFVAATLLYALILAIPFVPGVEIGVAILVMRGPDAAPAVYLATVLGLSLAYLIGNRLPLRHLQRLFSDLRLRRAAALIETIAPLSREERLERLRDRLPQRIGVWVTQSRYLAFAALLNLPLNAFLGGGGGLSMLAGLSGLFRTRLALPVIALAVLPVPLFVWLFGIEVLAGTQ